MQQSVSFDQFGPGYHESGPQNEPQIGGPRYGKYRFAVGPTKIFLTYTDNKLFISFSVVLCEQCMYATIPYTVNMPSGHGVGYVTCSAETPGESLRLWGKYSPRILTNNMYVLLVRH
jgi:hypothetical protein